jgi:ubiquinone/menaquinone biosynthesis C-methylase UbiE
MRPMSSKPYFDEIAPRWDKMQEIFFSEKVREKAISIANVQPGKFAADIGVGTGFITKGLLQKGLNVIAIDQSKVMIREMKKKFRETNKIDYHIGKAENLPIEDESIDYVFANMLLHHVKKPQVAIREMVRILKPKGMLVITDLDEHNFEFLRREHHDHWMGFKREDVKQWIIKAGLKKAKVNCIEENCCANSSTHREEEYASISIFVASGEKK